MEHVSIGRVRGSATDVLRVLARVGPVARIPDHGVADVREVGANLMSAACIEVDLEERASPGDLQGLVARARRLGPR